MEKLIIPADVPLNAHEAYREHYSALTKDTGRLFLFAADHKLEHLNADFSGPGIDPAAQSPEHLFELASKAPIGALATQLGLIARYGKQYPSINYVVKLNSKTNLRKDPDPFSPQLWSVDDVVSFARESQLPIRGIGLTIYLGSSSESQMLAQASQAVFKAHQHGLVALLWMYPRGSTIKDERDPQLLAGATGVAAALGADFVKIHPPRNLDALPAIIKAAGNTKVVCAGGEHITPDAFLNALFAQLSQGTSGAAIGRNLFQHALPDAIKLSKSVSALIYERKDITAVLKQ